MNSLFASIFTALVPLLATIFVIYAIMQAVISLKRIATSLEEIATHLRR